MDIIKQILIDDLNTINQREQRDGKPYFNSQFLANHPYLCIGMIAAYLPLAVNLMVCPLLWTLLDSGNNPLIYYTGKCSAI
ncbi:Inner membrane protein ylaC [Providencia alcalifaciens]|nr:Inner membrane protein ylaC [Providencia alcalifaciens]